ncbi:ArdC family protein [Acidovorax sp.]|jgi:antirestriction protein ArdC|uniref:ArdC family protein n=1 Tax=Acidovorax sp. TaxID=1872122 RepID=UPI00391F7203
MSDAKKPAKRDLYQEVTDKLIAAIEAGTAPWQRPWQQVASAGLPMNGATSREYNGVNALLLMMLAQAEGYSDNRWYTFKQASDMGAKVKKGSKSTPVYFFKMLNARGAEVDGESAGGAEQGGKERRQIPFLTEYRVFHATQIEGIEPFVQPERQWTPIEAVQEMVDRLKPDIRYGGDRAFYALGEGRDFIQMPPEGAFPSAEAFAGTLAHELGHWTGAEHRLGRKFGAWGTDAYAAEELRAEICSACLNAKWGIATSMDNHAAYVAAWVKKLRDDKFEIFRAAKDARRMVDYLTGSLVLDPKPDEAIAQESSPALSPMLAHTQEVEPGADAAAIAAVLAKARKSIAQVQRARRSGLAPTVHGLQETGAAIPTNGSLSMW